ncbi:beta-ketoacyl synthase N-terminal-like domain-containing protein [Streptomyces bohaiensis]|uniref:beta-ketoacyl synthase N-terminal-like domain-containing protein n=1 Tax=Streptomyces bohaiensis TaxID=1431344 RepID=UPI003B81E5FA
MPGHAIVGMGCRFPGAPSLAAYWELLCRGGDGIVEVPPDRAGPARPADGGRDVARRAGLLPDLDRFDAAPFGISAREAHYLDPQQRLVLEVVVEALADAGIAPGSLRGSDTGVFVGASGFEHGALAVAPGQELSTYRTTGSVLSIIANRVSYALDLKGPSIVVDTACSSSLVALGAAVDALRAGRCRVALVGGVNALLNPEMTEAFAAGGFMAADGRCKPFDHRADGYVRSEGAGVLVLRGEEAARAEGDRVYAVVPAVRVNQDGRSNGIFAPNGRSQERLLRSAYEDAGVDPGSVQYLEAHGTGTALGDPIEFGAVAGVLAVGREPGRELLMGSVKSNIGHLEAGAGVAGVIKVALAMHHGRVPPTLHLERPNPYLRLERHPVRIPTAVEPWPDTDGGERLAGVSSFGFGGTNAHAVLRAARPAAASPTDRAVPDEHPPFLVPLAAHSEAALRETAGEWASWLAAEGRDAEPAAVAATAAGRRDHPAHRAAVLADDRSSLIAALAAVAAGTDHPALVGVGRAPARTPRWSLAFGSSTADASEMAAGAVASDIAAGDWGAFAARAARELPSYATLHARLREEAGPGAAGGPDGALPRVETFLAQLAVARQLEALGLRPAVWRGSGAGEVTAACAAGELVPEDAVGLLASTSRRPVVRRGEQGGREAGGWWSAQCGGPVRSAEVDASHWAACLDAGPSAAPVADADDGVPSHGPRVDLAAWRPGAAADPGAARRMLLDTVARLYLAGLTPRWQPGARVALPAHAWDRRTYPLISRALPAASGDGPASAPTAPAAGELTPAVRALLESARDRIAALEETESALRSRLAERPAEVAAPVDAVVLGVGLRLPSTVTSTDGFWRLLTEGGNGVGRLTRDRDGRRGAGGRPWRPAGRLDSVDSFDPGFFGIGSEEARAMDPQQRLVLETAWEALEDGGVTAQRLRTSVTGVFVGTCGNDYLLLAAGSGERPDVWSASGVSHAVTAGRLSYHLDLRGPSLAVDTACSSSLTALHLALRALRAGECDFALVGGVNTLLDPYSTEMIESVLPFSAAGRCLSYEEGADGIVRGEGCGMLLLAREDVATREGLPGRGLVRGSAINQDGRTNGLTAPSPRGQREVLARALRDARLTGADIDYVEGHGTGTALGDPLEAEALAAVLGDGDKPCVLGSVKANLGHLEAAAGIAGVIKALLVLEHARVPAQPDFSRPGPGVRFTGTRLELASEERTLPSGRRWAGVSSFGFGGSNAHVVLEHDPARHAVPPPAAGGSGPLMLPLSARSTGALTALAGAWQRALADCDETAARRMVAAAAHRRDHHPVRTVRTAPDLPGLLTALAEPREAVEPHATRSVWLFTGQGSQWPAMAAGLLELPAAAAELRVCDAVVRETAGWSILAEATAPQGSHRLADTEIAQGCVAALQLALAAQLREVGLEPDAVVGHSMGELPAAVVAGVLDRPTMFRLLRARGRLIAEHAAEGRMVSVALPEAEVARLLARHDKVDIAAVNGPHSTVVSGLRSAVDGLCAELTSEAVRHTPLPGGYAFHSRLLEAAAAELALVAADIDPREPTVPFHSTVTGRPETRLDGAYWAANLRRTVRFADALASLPDATRTVAVEVGPHAVLTAEVLRGEEAGGPAFACRPVPLMRRGRTAHHTVVEAVGRLHETGPAVNPAAVVPPPTGRVTGLPSYPWQRTRHWVVVDREDAGAAPPPAAAPRAAAAPVDRVDLVAMLRRALVEALGPEAEAVDADTVLADWDIESLVIVEVRNQLGRRLGATLPLSAFFTAGSLGEVADRLRSAIDPTTGDGTADRDPGRSARPTEPERPDHPGPLDHLTDSEVEAMIARIEGTDAR